MSGKNKRMLATGSGSAVVLFCLFLLTYLAPNSSFEHNLYGRFVLTGDTPPVVQQSKLENHADPSQTLRIVVGLKLRDDAGLNKLLSEQRDPASPNYRKYISPEEFSERFSPTPQDVDFVNAYLATKGLKVVEISPNRTLVEAEGTVAQLEKAFSVTINQYTVHMPDGSVRSYLSNDRDPALPARLSTIVESVIGLDTYAEFHSRMLKSPQPRQQASKPWGYSPQDIATAYEFPTANNANLKGTAHSGKGKTIAIATAYTYDQKDVDAYWKQFGITRTGTLTNVNIGGTATANNEETTLDLETVSSQAPGADIIMYLGKDAKFTNFTKVFNRVVTDNKADVMTVSWGLCEEDTGTRQMHTEHNIFKQAAAQGIALFASSGDDGAYDCKQEDIVDKDGKKTPAPVKLSVDYPSSDPYVTAVGGTLLLVNTHGSRSSEWAWSSGGGGVSSEWKREAWQKGPGVPAGDMRVTADVSMNASPSTGYAFYFNGKWESWGGTSVSAPAWASLWAVIDEAASARIGLPVETLYRVGDSTDYKTVFHDITSGDNGDYRGPGYKAGDNWDHPTGWGVPNGEALKDWIVADRNKATTGTQTPDAQPSNKK